MYLNVLTDPTQRLCRTSRVLELFIRIKVVILNWPDTQPVFCNMDVLVQAQTSCCVSTRRLVETPSEVTLTKVETVLNCNWFVGRVQTWTLHGHSLSRPDLLISVSEPCGGDGPTRSAWFWFSCWWFLICFLNKTQPQILRLVSSVAPSSSSTASALHDDITWMDLHLSFKPGQSVHLLLLWIRTLMIKCLIKHHVGQITAVITRCQIRFYPYKSE